MASVDDTVMVVGGPLENDDGCDNDVDINVAGGVDPLVILDPVENEKAEIQNVDNDMTAVGGKSKEFKTVVNCRKRSGDKAVPTKAFYLKNRYHEVKNRSDITVREYLTQRGYTSNEYDTVIDRLLAEAVEKSNEEDVPIEDVPTVVEQSEALADDADACTEGIQTQFV